MSESAKVQPAGEIAGARWDETVGEVPRTSGAEPPDAAKPERSFAEHLAAEKLAKERQATDYRPVLFVNVLAMVWIIVVVNVVVIGALLNGSQISDAAVAAWFTGSTVQVVGLLAIITRNLFPTADDDSELGDVDV